MVINVTGKHLQVTGAMEDHAKKKCEKLSRFYDRIQSIDVVADKPGREFEVEVIAHVGHHDPFIGKSHGEDFYACMDGVIDKITRQIAEHKDKLRNRKHPG